MKYKVKNIDVDGSSSRSYKTLEGAIKRFEEMAGHTVGAAIAEAYYLSDPLPKIEEIRRLSAVGYFGNRVTLSYDPFVDEWAVLPKIDE